MLGTNATTKWRNTTGWKDAEQYPQHKSDLIMVSATPTNILKNRWFCIKAKPTLASRALKGQDFKHTTLFLWAIIFSKIQLVVYISAAFWLVELPLRSML